MKPAVIIFALTLLAACSHTPGNAPRSRLAREQAIVQARVTAAHLGGDVCTIAATGSMRPVLDEHTIVALDPAPFGELEAGDLVVYRSRTGAPIIHRLYKRTGEQWLVLGDALGSIDPETVTAENYTARVAALFYTSR